MTAIAQALSAALLEFVWQGLLAAFLLWTALMVLRNRPARTRYLASCVALAVMAMLPVVTACLVYTTPTRSQAPTGWAGTARQTMRGAMPDAADGFGWGGGLAGNWSIQIARWALPIWSLGVLLFALRLVWASRQISALRRHAKPAEAAVLSIVGGLQERMKLARPIRVLISAVTDCPSVVGWIRPAVLLPAATVLGLTPQQLEAVLAHELAHILRYDHLVNMLQTVVETLLFYHPAVWWASARIRQERELCCDDLAVAACGDALCYARALTRLERLRVTTPRLALGSAGGPLLYRIQRLAGDAGWQRGPSKLPGILALSLGLICFALNMTWARDQQHDAPVPDEPGVRVDLGGASVIHRDEVEYPEGAIEKRIQGSVVVEVTLDAAGMVSDARVLSGPPELRRAALQSVLQWHFTHDAAGSTRQIRIAFQLPAEGNATPLSAKRTQAMVDALLQKQLAESMAEQARALQSPQADDASELQAEARKSALRPRQMVLLEHELQALQKQATAVTESASELTDIRGDQMAAMEKRLAELQAGLSDSHDAAMFVGRRLKIIDIQSVSSAARDELLAKLPVHVGDTLAEDSMERVEATVKQFDEHLGLSVLTTHDGQVEIHITAPGSGDARSYANSDAALGGILRCMTAIDNLFGTTQLSSTRAATIKKTYLLLGLSVAGAFCGGYLGAQSDTLAKLFTGWLGWILAMVLLNVIPRVAIAARHDPVLGVTALLADGFVSGLVLAPILRIASLYAPGTIQIAMLMTLIVFGAVTLFVMSSNRTFSAPRGLMLGIAVSIIAAMVLNAFLNIGLLGMLIAAGIGILGVCILVYATSDVLNNPNADSPIPGALFLFAGLFNVFVAILNILLRLDRRR